MKLLEKTEQLQQAADLLTVNLIEVGAKSQNLVFTLQVNDLQELKEVCDHYKIKVFDPSPTIPYYWAILNATSCNIHLEKRVKYTIVQE